jgi:cell wall assembly regulator SMI1
LPDEVKASLWLGRPPASDSQISQAEERLGIALPPSYRTFLRVSNGWGKLTQSIWQLNAVEQLQ